MNIEERLLKNNALLTTISKAQSRFIAKADTRALFEDLLKDLLSLTDSEYGFIGEVRYNDNAQPFLRAHAVTNISWNDSIQALYEKHYVTGLEFKTLKSLYGTVLTTGEAVISNAPSTDPRRCGLPEGHPSLNAFLGIPFFLGNRFIGIVGIANRPNGYDEGLIGYLKPFLATCAHIIEAHNISKERESAIEALSNSEANLAQAQRIARLGSWTRDFSSNEAIWSDQIFKILGLERNITPGPEGFLKFVHSNDRAMVEATLEDAYRAHRRYEIEYRILLDDGSQKTVLEQAEVIASLDGTLQKAFGTLQDITERKRLEDELDKIQRLESLGLLAGGIAHDFNNILTAIVGNIHVAIASQSQDERKRVLAEAENAAFRASNLTRQLLTFSKGGAPIKRTARIGELVMTTAEFALRGSSVRCEFRIADDIRPIYADSAQIAQVINNMVINAKQAMPDGGAMTIEAENVLLNVHAFNHLAPGAYVCISIADTGCGIPIDILPSIFDPYFTTKSGGSGLGLASSFSIIKKHSGHIDVTSKTGKGTRFDVYLPASTEREEGEEQPTELKRGVGRVLVVDDEEAIRDVVAEVLGNLGYSVITAEDAHAGISLFKNALEKGKPFDVVILDLTIPGSIGGKDLLVKLRESDQSIKAIASSGYSNDPVMAEYKNYGFNGIVAKPYRIEELSRVVYGVINNVF